MTGSLPWKYPRTCYQRVQTGKPRSLRLLTSNFPGFFPWNSLSFSRYSQASKHPMSFSENQKKKPFSGHQPPRESVTKKKKRSPSPSLPSEDKAEGHSQSKAFCEHPGAAFGAAFRSAVSGFWSAASGFFQPPKKKIQQDLPASYLGITTESFFVGAGSAKHMLSSPLLFWRRILGFSRFPNPSTKISVPFQHPRCLVVVSIDAILPVVLNANWAP